MTFDVKRYKGFIILHLLLIFLLDLEGIKRYGPALLCYVEIMWVVVTHFYVSWTTFPACVRVHLIEPNVASVAARLIHCEVTQIYAARMQC